MFLTFAPRVSLAASPLVVGLRPTSLLAKRAAREPLVPRVMTHMQRHCFANSTFRLNARFRRRHRRPFGNSPS